MNNRQIAHLALKSTIPLHQAKTVRVQARTVRGQARTVRGQAMTVRGQSRTVRGQTRTVRGQARAVRGQVFVCLGYHLCLFLQFLYLIRIVAILWYLFDLFLFDHSLTINLSSIGTLKSIFQLISILHVAQCYVHGYIVQYNCTPTE